MAKLISNRQRCQTSSTRRCRRNIGSWCDRRRTACNGTVLKTNSRIAVHTHARRIGVAPTQSRIAEMLEKLALWVFSFHILLRSRAISALCVLLNSRLRAAPHGRRCHQTVLQLLHKCSRSRCRHCVSRSQIHHLDMHDYTSPPFLAQIVGRMSLSGSRTRCSTDRASCTRSRNRHRPSGRELTAHANWFRSGLQG